MRTYLIDNGKEYSSHGIHFVEVDPAIMNPLLALFVRMYPRDCRLCGALKEKCQADEKCAAATRSWRYHEFYEAPFVVAIVDILEWRVDKRQTIAQWIEDVVTGMSYEVADLPAALEFYAMVGRIEPNAYLGEVGDYYLRQPIKGGSDGQT